MFFVVLSVFTFQSIITITEIHTLHPFSQIYENTCPGIQWTKNGHLIANSSLLSITPSLPSDCGIYDCIDSDDSIIISVFLECFSLNTSITPSVIHARDKLGSTKFYSPPNETEIRMDCQVDNSSFGVRWLRNGNALNETNKRFVMTDNNSILTISPVEYGDYGVYLCQVFARERNVTNFTTSLTLNSGLFSLRVATELSLIEGEEYRLVCRIGGYPPPAYTWSKDGVEIIVNSATTNVVKTYNEGDTLIVGPLRLMDDGKYGCSGSNLAGEQLLIQQRLIIVDRIDSLWLFLGLVGFAVVSSSCILFLNYRCFRRYTDDRPL